jgi:hypothetical protein
VTNGQLSRQADLQTDVQKTLVDTTLIEVKQRQHPTRVGPRHRLHRLLPAVPNRCPRHPSPFGQILPEETLDDLPHMGEAVSQIPRRAGMLQPHRQASPPPRWTAPKAGYGSPPLPAPRSCRDCDAWMGYPRSLCQACQHWRTAGHPIGQCRRCRRDRVPLRNRRCRACLAHLSLHGPEAQDEPFTQLWFGVPIPAGLRVKHHPLHLTTNEATSEAAGQGARSTRPRTSLALASWCCSPCGATGPRWLADAPRTFPG